MQHCQKNTTAPKCMNVKQSQGMKSLEQIEAIVSAECEAQPSIIAAYLFGSTAKGKAKASSDLDVAVLLDDRQSQSFSLLSFIVNLEELFEKNVDVVVLNTADELLKYEVRRSGKILFDRFPQQRKRFEIRSRKAYDDFLFFHKRYTQKVLYGAK